jgi:hypothetical protein
VRYQGHFSPFINARIAQGQAAAPNKGLELTASSVRFQPQLRPRVDMTAAIKSLWEISYVIIFIAVQWVIGRDGARQ